MSAAASAAISVTGLSTKIDRRHLDRAAVVYVRQSTLAQLDRNRESTTRQFDLVARNPDGVHTRCRRSPQKNREWLAQ